MKINVLLTLSLFTLLFSKPAQKNWTAIGDSITYLNDHQDETANRLHKGYLTRVTEQLPDLHYINQGHNGWTAVGIAKEWDKLGVQASDIYSVFLGTNDWWQGIPVGTFDDYKNNTGTSTFFGAYRIITDKLKQLNPKAKVVLITQMQRQDFVYILEHHNMAFGSYKANKGQTLSQFANAVKTIAAYEHYDVVDLYYKSGINLDNMVKFKRLKDSVSGTYKNLKAPDFEGLPYNPDKDEYPYPPEAELNTYDGLHPSDKGCQIIADMLVKVLKRY